MPAILQRRRGNSVASPEVTPRKCVGSETYVRPQRDSNLYLDRTVSPICRSSAVRLQSSAGSGEIAWGRREAVQMGPVVGPKGASDPAGLATPWGCSTRLLMQIAPRVRGKPLYGATGWRRMRTQIGIPSAVIARGVTLRQPRCIRNAACLQKSTLSIERHLGLNSRNEQTTRHTLSSGEGAALSGGGLAWLSSKNLSRTGLPPRRQLPCVSRRRSLFLSHSRPVASGMQTRRAR